ncbi:MAG: ATP-binding protein [Bacteroidales bacterium]|nr:ATP-binding protein [Bacteroidales bacterium]
MGFKNFRFNLIVRILVLSVSIGLFIYLVYLAENRVFIAPVIVALAVIFQISSLIRFVDKTNRELTSFLESIRFSEFTRSFQIEGMGSSFDDLNKAFNEVIKDFQKVRSEKEEHFHYLQTIVQNIDVSLIAYRNDGNVELINKAAKKLFQVTNLKNISGLEAVSPELVNILFNIKPGENKLVRVADEEDILQLAIYATTIKIKDKEIVLTTIKNIQNVLEEQETEAWQKLIRVLTHEIMNSITPIASLSSTLNNIIMQHNLPGNGEKRSLDKADLDEIQEALQTINKRSIGLLHFVNTYRNLTRIPKPNFKVCNLADIFVNIQKLLDEEIAHNNLQLVVKTEPEIIRITADEQLVEQVLINLIKNSIFALQKRENGVIQLLGFLNKRGRPTIQVIDNGPGILSDVLDKIFIPFFTTKPSGSGIGLSLSKQIIRLHNGSITAHSVPDKETVFTLSF